MLKTCWRVEWTYIDEFGCYQTASEICVSKLEQKEFALKKFRERNVRSLRKLTEIIWEKDRFRA